MLDFSFSSDGLVHINDEQAKKLKNVELHPDDVLLNITVIPLQELVSWIHPFCQHE